MCIILAFWTIIEHFWGQFFGHIQYGLPILLKISIGLSSTYILIFFIAPRLQGFAEATLQM